jgi:hypothetical protein
MCSRPPSYNTHKTPCSAKNKYNGSASSRPHSRPNMTNQEAPGPRTSAAVRRQRRFATPLVSSNRHQNALLHLRPGIPAPAPRREHSGRCCRRRGAGRLSRAKQFQIVETSQQPAAGSSAARGPLFMFRPGPSFYIPCVWRGRLGPFDYLRTVRIWGHVAFREIYAACPLWPKACPSVGLARFRPWLQVSGLRMYVSG